MSPISDNDVHKYRCILMYDDETVMDAVRELRDQNGQDWWHLVVDLDGGDYAIAHFTDLSTYVDDKGAEFLDKLLGDLVGEPLIKVDVIAEQDDSNLATVREKTAESDSRVAIIVSGGEFKGIIPMGGTRSADGAFGGGLVQLAGNYAEIPAKGVLSRRRRRGNKK